MRYLLSFLSLAATLVAGVVAAPANEARQAAYTGYMFAYVSINALDIA